MTKKLEIKIDCLFVRKCNITKKLKEKNSIEEFSYRKIFDKNLKKNFRKSLDDEEKKCKFSTHENI